MDLKIRPLVGEDMLETLYRLNSYALHASPPLQNKEEWMAIVSERRGITCHAAFEGENAVSIVVSTPMTQNMRGKLFAVSGIWGVSTDPSARRKGYCRQVMASVLATEKESGKVFSNLYPFRESFYEKLGYVGFPHIKITRFSAAALSSLVKEELGGEIKLQLIEQAFAEYRAYLAEMRLHRHGMAFFDFGDMGRIKQNLIWVASAVFDGHTEGVMLYRTSGNDVTKYQFIASRFYYQTSRARYLMLGWIARHIDQVNQVELWLPEDEYPETWLADLEIKVESPERPGMCRVLDIERLDGMKVGEGSFSAHINDPLCPWNEGNWNFRSEDGELKVTKSSSVDCELAIQGLSALVAGTRDPQDYSIRGWGNPREEMQACMRKLFPMMRPYMHEMF